MARITIDTVKETIAADGWEVVSREYKNLKEILHYKCSEGHDVYAPFERIRRDRHCPVCAANIYKDQDTTIIPKGAARRTLALDQSTNLTAWAVFDGTTLVKYGTFLAKGEPTPVRFIQIRDWVLNMMELWEPDQIVLEDIQLQNFGKGSLRSGDNTQGILTYKVLAQLQGLLLVVCEDKKIPVKLAPTPSWRAHCGVRGQTRIDKKRSIQTLVKKWYDISISDDEADAIGIGKYAIERLFNEPEMGISLK